jgi:hypothetical protein
MSDAHEIWGPTVARNNQAAAQARALREEKRAGEVARREEQRQSDLVALSEGLNAPISEGRVAKPMRGAAVPRPLPRRFQERIANLPADHPLRTGAVKPFYDVVSGTWKADLPAPAQEAKSEGGHFKLGGLFSNTSRRQREREIRR